MEPNIGLLQEIIGKIDVYSIGGLAVAIAIIMEFLKGSLKAIKGYEDVVTVVLTVLAGIGIRLFDKGFQDTGVIGLVIQLALAATIAQILYDKVIAPFYPSSIRAVSAQKKLSQDNPS